MVITDDIVKGAYSYLVETPPFCGWNLPDPEELSFKATRSRKRQGEFTWFGDGRCEEIRVSKHTHNHTLSLLATVAHEMIHLHQHQVGLPVDHGDEFWLYANEVCTEHGFDPGQF